MHDMINPQCPMGHDMELLQVASGGWRYGCTKCATSYKVKKRAHYGWLSPIKSTKERAYAAALMWIDAKDKLPGLGEVLICTKCNWVGVAWHHGGGVFESGSGVRLDGRVSYWMPLPQPPKEADHADAT